MIAPIGSHQTRTLYTSHLHGHNVPYGLRYFSHQSLSHHRYFRKQGLHCWRFRLLNSRKSLVPSSFCDSTSYCTGCITKCTTSGLPLGLVLVILQPTVTEVILWSAFASIFDDLATVLRTHLLSVCPLVYSSVTPQSRLPPPLLVYLAVSTSRRNDKA